MIRIPRALTLLPLALAAVSAHAQVSLSATLELALTASPKVQSAQAEVARARALLAEAHAPYIPSVSATTAFGRAYGFPLGTPSILNVNVGSLLYSPAQHDYVLASRAGINAAMLSLEEARQSLEEDVALTYFAVLRDQERDAGLAEQVGFAERLVQIVSDRTDAGLDSAIDLTQARLNLANLRYTRLKGADDLAYDRGRLARYTGLPAGTFVVEDKLPPFSAYTEPVDFSLAPLSANVAASYASARAKLLTAQGDARYLYRPQITFGFQYALFSTSYGNYNNYYNQPLQTNNVEVGAQVTFPFYDRTRKAKAQESAAIASRALHDADDSRSQWVDSQSHLYNATKELRARQEIASLELQLAQQQLAIIQIQLGQAQTGQGPQITPKDEQNSRIAASEKQLAVTEALFNLRQSELSLLHQNGHLEDWIHTVSLQAPAANQQLIPGILKP